MLTIIDNLMCFNQKIKIFQNFFKKKEGFFKNMWYSNYNSYVEQCSI